jgi:hypothetical protein
MKVELQPALQAHCDFCGSESWHDCTVRTGEEAIHRFMQKMAANASAMELINRIRSRAKQLDMRVPSVPNLAHTFFIESRGIHCKMCGNGVGSLGRGFRFICDECGRDNYFMPQSPDDLHHVQCEHCSHSFEAVHFMNSESEP